MMLGRYKLRHIFEMQQAFNSPYSQGCRSVKYPDVNTDASASSRSPHTEQRGQLYRDTSFDRYTTGLNAVSQYGQSSSPDHGNPAGEWEIDINRVRYPHVPQQHTYVGSPRITNAWGSNTMGTSNMNNKEFSRDDASLGNDDITWTHNINHRPP